MWLWCFGFMLVWILNMKLLNLLLVFLIVFFLVLWLSGVGVYLIKLLSIWLILKLFNVVLKNIGVNWFFKKSFCLNLLDVLCISLSLLCKVLVRLFFIVVFNLGLFNFLMMCMFWIVWFWLFWYKIVLLWWRWYIFLKFLL